MPPKRPGGVQELAGGGIVSSPTYALLGERGPEAVVPLGRNRKGSKVSIAGGQIDMIGSDVYVLQIQSQARTENVVANYETLRALAAARR